ncbi:hypothetical protein SD909_004595 [Vibrio parahaemolyticus]|nr:hypothetical protein [Vibrio parahaemolyticus]
MENKEILDALNSLIEIARLAKEQPDAPVLAAKYTVFGMLGVAFITLVGQLFSTRFLVKSEMRKTLVHVKAELDANFSVEWNRDIESLITDLLVATDPEVNSGVVDKERVIHCVHKLNLKLNQNYKTHSALDCAVNDLAMTVNGWEVRGPVFDLQNRVIQTAKKVIYQPKI